MSLLRSRISRLEAAIGTEADIGLEDWVRRSFREELDPAFSERFSLSKLGRLAAETIQNNRVDQ